MSNETNDGWTEVTAKDKLEDLKAIVKAGMPWISETELLIGIYFYASNYYMGQGDLLYQVTCLINFRFSGSEESVLKDLPDAVEAVDLLERHFAR
jgi:hypothetical protein